MSTDECGICYETIGDEARVTLERCGHTFHWQCAKAWIDTKGNAVTCPLCRGALTRNNKTGPTLKWTRSMVARVQRDIGPFVAVSEALERTKRRLMDERTTLVVPGMKRRLDTLTKATQNETNPIGRACLLTQLSAPDEPRSAKVKRFVQIARSALTLETKKERLRRSAETLAKRKYEYDLYELMKRLRRYR